MVKTTIYLPQELKTYVENRARETGASEARAKSETTATHLRRNGRSAGTCALRSSAAR
jgi:hypothetical protein